MNKDKIKKIIAWVAVAISLAISSFWAYWGIEEFFHEGWYSSSFFYGLFLFFIQYMSAAIMFTVLALVAIKHKKTGLFSYIAVGVFCVFFFHGASFQVVYLSLAIPFVVLGLLFYFSDFGDTKKIKWILIVPSVLIVLVLGTPLLIRNMNRLNDGNYGQRVLNCQGENIVWAQRGPGFPEWGATWAEAQEACQHLSADGSEILAEEVNVWRLPSVEEAIKCQMSHNENAGGVWDEESRQAEYEKTPDKETPLWQPDSEIIYYWTSEMSQETENQAYIFTYDGKIYDKDIRYSPDYQSFRCIMDYDGATGASINSAFPQRDEAIEEYLLTQRHFAWQTEEGTRNACVFENLGDEGGLFPLSLWVYCHEYKIDNGEVVWLSGVSGPVLVDYPNTFSYFSLDRFTHQVPRDGSFCGEDIKDIFSKKVQDIIFSYQGANKLRDLLEQRILDQG